MHTLWRMHGACNWRCGLLKEMWSEHGLAEGHWQRGLSRRQERSGQADRNVVQISCD